MMEHKEYCHTPLISFIITYYNIPITLLQRCIESIISLKIDTNDREIILIDDGSEQSPLNELYAYKEQIKFFRQQNRGLSAARNIGIELSKGEYIQFVDGDDCLIKNGYDSIINKVKEYNENTYNINNADLLLFGMSRNEFPRKNLAHILNLFWWTTSNRFLTEKNIKASACGYLFRRKILNGLRFSEAMFHEDEEFTPLLLINSKRVYFTSIKAYYYRRRKNSITNNVDLEHTKKRLNDFFDIIIKLNSLSFKPGYELLKRRVHQLSMDYVYNVITKQKDFLEFQKAIESLYKYMLLPLPIRFYTLKYLCFSLLSKNKYGRILIYKILSKL